MTDLERLEKRLEEEVRRINFVCNGKLDKTELQNIKESFLEAFEDVRTEQRYLSKRITQLNRPKKEQLLNNQTKICLVILIIQIILIIIA